MGLVYFGIDEAGYGPLLGPLCVSIAGVRIEHWREGDPAPDLWATLSRAVCRKPERGSKAVSSMGRIAVDDSKKLKLSNSSKSRDPLVHLERGVLTFLRCRRYTSGDDHPPTTIADDAGLFKALGLTGAPATWYAGDALPCPRACDAGVLGISSAMLERELLAAGVGVEMLSCRAVGEREFNHVVEHTGTKAAATELGIGKHLAAVWKGWVSNSAALRSADSPPPTAPADTVRVVCDRQGGRTQYAASLVRMMAAEGVPVEVQTLEESPARSRYELRARAEDASQTRDQSMVVMFMPEAESQHLPVALASMTAKLVRELFMARFNRYWCARMPELKPTAGYRQDGWRWLEDLGPMASETERLAMIRRA